MLKTDYLPCLTNFLRTYGNVSAPWAKEIEDDPRDLINKRKQLDEQQSRLYSLETIKEFFMDNSDLPRNEITKLFRELLTHAKETVGFDSSLSEVEGAVIHFIDAFRDCEVLSGKHTTKLRRLFKTITEAVIDKTFCIVQKLVKSLNDSVSQEFITTGLPKLKDDGLELEEFGCRMKFNDAQPLDDSYYLFPTTSNCDTINDTFSNLSLMYKDPTAQNKQPNVAIEKCEYDSSWLRSEISKCNQGNESQMPVNIVTNQIVSMLQSERSNNELENDLFELLGIEHYELIQKIFVHRKSLIALKKDDIKPITSIQSKSNPESMPPYLRQVIVQTESEKMLCKQLRKDEKKIQKFQTQISDDEDDFYFDPKHLKFARELQLEEARNAPLFSKPTNSVPLRQVRYPNVYDSFLEVCSSAASINGYKLKLPENHKRHTNQIFEEIGIPAVRRSTNFSNFQHVPISALDPIGQKAFSGISSLNLIQSIVFNIAYNTNENMLVCAPTGAGKTNVAMLTIIHEIKNNTVGDMIKKDKFKIIYVAPMKALASEMVRNFSSRLKSLGIQVKELTGDMQLTKTEIMETQIIVTTPEKWDVVTRKSTGDVKLSQIVKLLILDEVHLLDGDRGPVLEAIVARTLRQVESSQSMIRILGLSATLPNYVDVARFLVVNPKVGLFFFDDRFRPVPLSSTFIGIKAKSPSQQIKDMNEICYMKIVKFVERKHQVMVFVHARNATVNSAFEFINLAKAQNQVRIFTDMVDTKEFGAAQTQMGKSRNKQLREMFEYGFAIHHAGMLRMDRNYVEKFFREGLIKVLVCTSTLAWGVNLPAHAVVIKGTEIYDSKRGSFVPLGVLDVMQIFGRAGRPQYDTEGHGTIITTHNQLNHYLSLLTRQHQIESNFECNLADNLNAEIGLGTVTNVEEGIEWLSYTYLHIRMLTNPHAYGLKPHTIQNDCDLYNHRKNLIIKAAEKLDEAKMIRFEPNNGYLFITDLGRTASHFYISYDTVMRFQEHLQTDFLNDDDILYVIANAKEFDQLKVREDEMNELDHLLHESRVYVKGGCENKEGKVNILLQTYLSRLQLNSFSLISDQAYVIQNSTRIVRFLFESALRNGCAMKAANFLRVSLMIERQQWHFKSPLRQFPDLNSIVLDKVEKCTFTFDRLRDMRHQEIGAATRCTGDSKRIKWCLEQIPNLEVTTNVQPITDHILRLTLHILPAFTWVDKIHGMGSEPFWIWIEDPESDMIYHFEYFLLPRKQVLGHHEQQLVFTIPLDHSVTPSQYLVRVISDRWLGCDLTFEIDFQKLILPCHYQPKTELLDLQPLPVTALNSNDFESLYKFQYFNPIQTQIFHTLYHTDNNVLLGAPTGSGKTIAAEIAMLRVFKEKPKMKVVYIAPLKALVRERIEDWKVRYAEKLQKKVIELTGDVTPDARAIANADIIVTTPEKWDGVSRSWQTRNYVQAIALMVIDEIHLLGESRGPVLEVIVSRTNFISAHTTEKVRIIGLSTALANAHDLASWLSIKEVGLYNFRPSVRPVPLTVHVSGHPGKHYCPRMAVMNKPTFQAIRLHSPDKPSLVFVSSRRQTRLTALDLIAFLATEGNPRQWLHMPDDEIQNYIVVTHDQNLKLTLAFGIGLHHAGLHERDRKIVEKLFLEQKIQVLIATATLAWGVNLPAHLVVIKGTEYYDGKIQRYVDFPITDVLQMIGRAGRPQFDHQGVAVVLVQDIKKNFYKKFLYEPFPVESSLISVLPDHLNAEIVSGTIHTRQQCLDYLTWTFFFRRLMQNPGYYGLEATDPATLNLYLSNLVNKCLETLQVAMCIVILDDEREIESTILGRIASYYYLTHKTLYMFRSHLNEKVDMDKMLWILCEASEYDELPVRHNEDSINETLSKDCPMEVNIHTFDNPHTKTNLLLQAHFTQLALPCGDYYTDLKSVLDQAIRITQAIIDVAADKGWLSTTISGMMLLQMILQARWYHDNPLLILPHVKPQHLNSFRFLKDASTMAKVKTRMEWQMIHSLPEFIQEVSGRRVLLENIFHDVFAPEQIDDIFETVISLPVIEIKSKLRGLIPGFQSEQVRNIRLEETSGARLESTQCLKLHSDQEYTLDVEFLRKNTKRRKDTKALTPNFPKQKDEGWFLVLGIVDTKELVAMKRIPFVGSKSNHQITFFTPESESHLIYTLFIISDSYLGLDQQYDIHIEVTNISETKQNEGTSEEEDSDDSIYVSEDGELDDLGS